MQPLEAPSHALLHAIGLELVATQRRESAMDCVHTTLYSCPSLGSTARSVDQSLSGDTSPYQFSVITDFNHLQKHSDQF